MRTDVRTRGPWGAGGRAAHEQRDVHAGPPIETVYRPRAPFDLAATVGVLARGPHDPTLTVDGPVHWVARRTSRGAATLALRTVSGEVRATAWGPGAEEAVSAVPALCGADDDLDGFDAQGHPLLADAVRRNPGLRLPRTGQVFEALAGAVLEQKITSLQAYRSWRRLVTRYGDRAPGPTPRPMSAAPDAEGWRRIPSWAWHRAGVEPPQSRAIAQAATRGERIAQAVLRAENGNERDRVLTSLPGIGPWTAAETRIRALGDPDAVSVGDYHLPHIVGYALIGRRVEDPEMLQLLAPWAGHRQRVIRLIVASGVREPRRGPRLAPEDHRDR